MDDCSCPTPAPAGSRTPTLVAAFATIYLVWGATFLGIKFAVKTLPPLMMAGGRFLVAGLVLFAVLRIKGARPTGRQWLLALVTGGLLLLGGNGLVTWGQLTVPSGRAALVIATTPVWMVVLAWLLYGGPRPTGRVVVGMLMGFAGAALLVRMPAEGEPGSLLGYLAILAAPAVWSLGSLETRRARVAEDPLLTSALQMVAGGGLMLVAGLALGEGPRLVSGVVSARSLLAFAYLALFGALVGFTTYAWLLRNASPTAVATYAYVNPLVAVILAWLFTDEGLPGVVLLAAGLIVAAVVLITLPSGVRLPWRRAA